MADNCISVVSEAALRRGLSLNDANAEAIVKELRKEIRSKPVFSQAELNEAARVAVDKFVNLKMQARQAKREAMLRMVRREAINDSLLVYSQGPIVDAFKSFRNLTQTNKEIQAYNAFQVGTSQFVTGARDSAATRSAALTNGNISAFFSALRKKGESLESALRKGTYDKEAMIYAMDKTADVPQEAKDIVDTIQMITNGLREKKNRLGAFVGRLEEFLYRQQHDSELIKKVTLQAYTSDFLRLVDHERTFGPGASQQVKEEIVRDYYNRFKSGSHYKVDDAGKAEPVGGRGMNLAKRISQSRQIHFLNGETAFEYANKYSRGSMFDKVIAQLEIDAKTITMLERYGPNPRAMHEQIKADIIARAQQRGEDIPTVKIKELDANFSKLNGELDIPGSSSLAHVGFSLRALESMSKLGGAVLGAFPDIVFKGAALNRMTDMGFFDSYIQAFRGALGRLPKEEKNIFLEMTGVYADTYNGNSYRRAGAIDGMPGQVNRLQEAYFRVNLLQGWTVNNKAGALSAFAYYMGTMRNTDFDALGPKTRRTLELYNITAEEWSLMRHMDTLETKSGKNFLTEGEVETIPDDVLDAVISKKLNTLDITENMRLSFKDELAAKLRSMNFDFSETAVITPGSREQVLMTFGTQKGTVLGEFVRMVGQFRAFPVTLITKQIMPEYYGAGGGVRGVAALVPMVILATAFGYLSGAAKDLLKGREPKNPLSAATWSDAMVRGGGLGLFGDFMFAEYSRFGRSFEEELLGPGINTIGDALSLAHRAATTDGVDAGDVFRQIKGITPGANLFYTEAAFNYLFFYGLMESYDPGFLRRMQANRERDYDQEFWLPPTESAVQF